MNPEEIKPQENNEQTNHKETLEKVQKEVDDLLKNNDVVEGLSGLLTNEFGEFLKGEPNVLNSLLEACKDYKDKNPDVINDKGFEELFSFLEGISGNEKKDDIASKEYTTNSIEKFNGNMIMVTLRGDRWRNLEGDDLNKEKQIIAEELNGYVEMRDVLPAKVQELLILTKSALETKSVIRFNEKNGKNEPYSDAVVALENELVELNAMNKTADPGRNNGVDGKFGNETYDALMTCIEKSLKDSAEVKAENINTKLQGKYKELEGEDLNKVKQNISDKINEYRVVWDYLPNDAKNLLLLTKTALETPSENNDTSKEVVALQNELGFANIQTADGLYKDGKIGDKTFNSLVNYMENLQLRPIEICEKWDFKVTLRGKRNAEGKTGEEKVKTTEGGITEIKGMLTPYVENWDKLPFEKKKILVLAKNALETKSQIINKNGKEEPYSDEVVQLEDALVKVNAMPRIANDGNNGVDGKLGDKTMTALVAYLKKDEENMIK